MTVTHNHPIWVIRKPGEPLVSTQTVLYKLFHISPYRFELTDSRGKLSFVAKSFKNRVMILHNNETLGRIDRDAHFIPYTKGRPVKLFHRWYRRCLDPMFPYTFKERN